MDAIRCGGKHMERFSTMDSRAVLPATLVTRRHLFLSVLLEQFCELSTLNQCHQVTHVGLCLRHLVILCVCLMTTTHARGV